MRVYGWYELNRSSYAIQRLEISEDDIVERVGRREVVLSPLTGGRWFLTLGEARIAAKRELQEWINDLRVARDSVTATRVRDFK